MYAGHIYYSIAYIYRSFEGAMTSSGVMSKAICHKFRIVFSIYLQNLNVRQLPEPELKAIFEDYSKWEINFVDSLSV